MRKQEVGQPQPTLIRRVMELAKKIYYDSVFNVKVVLNSQKNSRAWILGRQYRRKKDIQTAIGNIIWLTYREQISGKLVRSDVGWGCMIRVGQMLLAQTFRRHLGSQKEDRQSLMDILTAFIDDDEGLTCVGNYSIQKIMRQAIEQYEMKVGQWHSPSSISYCLQKLHHGNPLPHTQGLRIHICQSALMYDKVIQQQKNESTSLLIIVLCMLGIYQLEKEKIDSIKAMQRIRYFNGIIGGMTGRAYYFLGHTDDNFVYLDPHVVQKGSNRCQIEMNLKTFFCNYTLSLNSHNVHPSMGICFYVRNRSQLNNLFSQLYAMKQRKVDPPFTVMKNSRDAYFPNKQEVRIIDVTDHTLSEQEYDSDTQHIIELNKSFYAKQSAFKQLQIEPTCVQEIVVPMERKTSEFQALEEYAQYNRGENSSIFEVLEDTQQFQ